MVENRNGNQGIGMNTEHKQGNDREEMERLRREYEKIPVPDAARFRLKQGIRQAKQERAKKSAVRWFKGTGTVMVASLAALMVVVNTSQAAAETLGQVPVLGSITRVVTFRDYTDRTNHFEAKVEVPKVETDTGADGALSEEQKKNYELTNEEIDAYAQKFISDYEQALGASRGEGSYALDSSYRVLRDDDKVLSIRIDTTVIMAGGTQYVKVYNIDKATGKALGLRDIFRDPDGALEAIGDNIRQQMETQMEQDEMKSYFLDGEADGLNFKGLTGEESYYLNGSGELALLFSEYEVAPGYMGAVEFTIPASVTAGYLLN